MVSTMMTRGRLTRIAHASLITPYVAFDRCGNNCPFQENLLTLPSPHPHSSCADVHFHPKGGGREGRCPARPPIALASHRCRLCCRPFCCCRGGPLLLPFARCDRRCPERYRRAPRGPPFVRAGHRAQRCRRCAVERAVTRLYRLAEVHPANAHGEHQGASGSQTTVWRRP